jgi:hypothetical protein
VSYNRVVAPLRRGPLISGNQIGINLNGYGVTDNIILATSSGWMPAARKCSKAMVGIAINMGQKHDIIGVSQQARATVSPKRYQSANGDPGIEYH